MQVSAFVDGELPENEAELLVRRLSQDAVLRQQVAEYLAIGRIMRGEYSAQGSDVLRERIAAELDERPLQDVADSVVIKKTSRYVRPLAGFAIAASVALIAIIGLRQTIDVGITDNAVVADEVVSEIIPTMSDEEHRQYLLLHELDTGSLSTRVTSLQIRADELAEEAAADDVEKAQNADDTDDPSDDAPVTSQPQ